MIERHKAGVEPVLLENNVYNMDGINRFIGQLTIRKQSRSVR
jgi:hypothetical protein